MEYLGNSGLQQQRAHTHRAKRVMTLLAHNSQRVFAIDDSYRATVHLNLDSADEERDNVMILSEKRSRHSSRGYYSNTAILLGDTCIMLASKLDIKDGVQDTEPSFFQSPFSLVSSHNTADKSDLYEVALGQPGPKKGSVRRFQRAVFARNTSKIPSGMEVGTTRTTHTHTHTHT